MYYLTLSVITRRVRDITRHEIILATFTQHDMAIGRLPCYALREILERRRHTDAFTRQAEDE